jgi:transcriptional regulator GlxA family with amidase domain
MHVVAVIAFEGVVGFDLAIPCQVFGSAFGPEPTRLYDVRVCGPRIGVGASSGGAYSFGITPPYGLDEAVKADTVVIPGGARGTEPWAPEVIEVLRAAHARGARIISICTGAFLLAAAGLLDGRQATTHWFYAAELARRFPQVQVDPAVLFIDEGDVLTSAGVAAGLDLCLHVVRRDHGATVAGDVARSIVMPLQRDGGQAQFIAHEQPQGSLEPTMRWMEERLDEQLQLTDIARAAAMSTRTLNRRFREQTGTTPLQWLIRQRIIRAQQLLESTSLPVEEIAQQAGFGTAVALRQHFARLLNISPLAYRRTFQVTSSGRR